MKLLKEKPPPGTVLFSTFAFVKWKRPQEEAVRAAVSASSSDPWGTGTSCFRLGELRKAERRGCDVCRNTAQKKAVGTCRPPQGAVVATVMVETGWQGKCQSDAHMQEFHLRV